MSEIPSTRWVRAPRIPTATRTDGLAVALDQNHWVLLVQGVPQMLRTPGGSSFLERAVEEADETFPPAPWTFAAGVWTAGVWQVRPNGDNTWGVFREIEGTVEQASRQPFPSADRARRWAELRFDRGAARLRGPKPRAGSKAACKLPDVRVTEEERAHAMDVLGRLGLGYSDFVRAALSWAETHILTEDGRWCVGEQEEGGSMFAPRPDA